MGVAAAAVGHGALAGLAEGLDHAATLVAVATAHEHVGGLPGDAALLQLQQRLVTRRAAVGVQLPGEVVEVAVAAGDQEPHRLGGGRPALGGAGVFVAHPVGAVGLALQREQAAADGPEVGTPRAAQPAREGRHGHADGGVGVSEGVVAVVAGIGRQPQGGDLLAQTGADLGQ